MAWSIFHMQVVFLQILILEMLYPDDWCHVVTFAIVIDNIYNSQILFGVKDDYSDYFLKTDQWKIINSVLYWII